MFRDSAWRGLTALLACLTYFSTASPIWADPPHTQWKNLTILETPGEGTGFYTYNPGATPQSIQCWRGRLAFSPDGKFLTWPWHEPNNDNFGVPKRQLFRLHDFRTGTTTSIPNAQGDFPGALGMRFTEDGRHFLAAGHQSLQLWDVGQKKWVRSLPKGEWSYAYPVHSLAVTTQAVFARKSGKAFEVLRWSLADGSVQVVPQLGGGFALAPDGQRQAGYALDFEKFEGIPYLEFRDPTGQKQRVAWSAKDHGRPQCGVFSPDGRLFAASGNLLEPKGEGFDVRWAVRVLETATLKVRWEVRNLEPPVGSFDWCLSGLFSRDGRYFALENKDELVVHETDKGREVARLPRPLQYGVDPQKNPKNLTALWDFAFAPDSSAIATAWDDGTVRLWGVVGKPPPPEPRPAVIILPGVCGSDLYVGEDEVWPLALVGNRNDLRMNEDGISVRQDVTTKDVLRERPLANFYGPLIQFLGTQDYVENRDLFLFPYDWRKPTASHLDRKPQDTFKSLDELVQRAITNNPSGARKVILVCHSMGGLVARAYVLSRKDWADKVKKIITLGTPYRGSPKAYYALVNGYDFDNPSVATGMMHLLAQNIPGAYELLPDSLFLRDRTTGRLLDKDYTYGLRYRRTIHHPFLSWHREYTYSDHFDQSVNKKLLKDHDAFYAKFGSTAEDSGVETHAIVGVGPSTMIGFWRAPLRHASDVVPGFMFVEHAREGRALLTPIWGRGDGTVPRHSAVCPGVPTCYLVQAREGDSTQHGDLPKCLQVHEILGALLAQSPNEQVLATYRRPSAQVGAEEEPDAGDRCFCTLRSDAVLSLVDDSGRKLGLDVEGRLHRQMGDATFYLAGESECAVLADLQRKYRATVTGLCDGKFTLELQVVRSGREAKRFAFRDVPVAKGTTAVVNFVPNQLTESVPELIVTHEGQTRKISAAFSTTPPAKERPGGKESPLSPVPDGTGDKGAPAARGDDWLWLAGGAGAGVLTLGVVAGCLFLLSRRGATPPAVRQPGMGGKARKAGPVAHGAASSFTITCPLYTARIKVPVKLCGRTAHCPNCKRMIGIPNLPNKPTGRG